MKILPKTSPPWRILFLGTDSFSLTTLQALHHNTLTSENPGGIISHLHLALPHFNKPNTNVIEKFADKSGLKQLLWPLDVDLVRERYDVAVLASFGHLIPRRVIELFPYGILNVHPSLLPRWRGAAPLHHTVLSGDLQTGVTIMNIQPKIFDRGQILAQKPITLSPRPTLSSVRDHLGLEGGKMIIDVLNNLPEVVGDKREQSEENVSYAHKITKENVFINWEAQTVDQLDRQYRTLSGSSSALRSEYNGCKVSLTDMCEPHFQPAESLSGVSAGFPMFDKTNNVIWVKCKDSWAGFRSIIIKKRMTAKAFYNGYLSKKHLQGVCFVSKKNNLFDDSYLERISNPRPL